MMQIHNLCPPTLQKWYIGSIPVSQPSESSSLAYDYMPSNTLLPFGIRSSDPPCVGYDIFSIATFI